MLSIFTSAYLITQKTSRSNLAFFSWHLLLYFENHSLSPFPPLAPTIGPSLKNVIEGSVVKLGKRLGRRGSLRDEPGDTEVASIGTGTCCLPNRPIPEHNLGD